MPAVTDKDTREVSQQDLADMINRTPTAVSQATRRKYFCAGYPVFEWAEWHPAGKQIRHYNVPVQVLKEIVPDDELTKHAIFD